MKTLDDKINTNNIELDELYEKLTELYGVQNYGDNYGKLRDLLTPIIVKLNIQVVIRQNRPEYALPHMKNTQLLFVPVLIELETLVKELNKEWNDDDDTKGYRKLLTSIILKTIEEYELLMILRAGKSR